MNILESPPRKVHKLICFSSLFCSLELVGFPPWTMLSAIKAKRWKPIWPTGHYLSSDVALFFVVVPVGKWETSSLLHFSTGCVSFLRFTGRSIQRGLCRPASIRTLMSHFLDSVHVGVRHRYGCCHLCLDLYGSAAHSQSPQDWAISEFSFG
jgi:hypothetical protein